jgi:hypothetical protein
MPRTNRPLDHRLPFLRGPIKGCGPPLKHTAPHTPSPFASLRLKVPLNEAHRPPAPIFAARPSPATPRQAITSNGFPYVPPPPHLFGPSRRYSSHGDAGKAALRQACHHLCPAVHGAPLEALVHEALHQVHSFIHSKIILFPGKSKILTKIPLNSTKILF